MSHRAPRGLGLLGAVLTSLACGRASSVSEAQSAPLPNDAQTAGQYSTRGAAQSDSALGFPFLPDPAKTPGDVLEVTAADVCVPGYSRKVRNVPAAVKRQVYASYGIRHHEPGEYEVDHLISLKLGGSNSIRNLWPESFRTSPWNAQVKDALEDELYRRVCAGTLDLATAQKVIARNWVSGYRIYVNRNPSSATAGSSGNRRSHRRRAHRSQPPAEAPVP